MASIGALLVAIPAAWSVSRSPGRQKYALYGVVATYMLPPVALVVPIYFALSAMGALNNVFSLAMVYLTIRPSAVGKQPSQPVNQILATAEARMQVAVLIWIANGRTGRRMIAENLYLNGGSLHNS